MKTFFYIIFCLSWTSYVWWSQTPRPIQAHTAAVMSAPFIGCEAHDIDVLRVDNAGHSASWSARCQNKNFVCGSSWTMTGLTIFCHQVGCVSEPPKPEKVKV